MSGDLLAAAAGGDNDAWASLTGDLAPVVWSHVATVSDYGRALDAGSVVFHRLADECDSVRLTEVIPWIEGTAAEAIREAESVSWRVATPAIVRGHRVPGELLTSAEEAYGVRAASRPIATLILDTADPDRAGATELRAATLPWRASDPSTGLLLPEAVWRGVFAAGNVTIDVTLIASGQRRLVGSVSGIEAPHVRLRGDEAWQPTDPNGRFRITSVTDDPLSVEVADVDNAIVTQWRAI